MNDFKKSLQVKLQAKKTETKDEIINKIKEQFKNNETKKYNLIYTEPKVQEYISNVVATIMLSHYQAFGQNTNVNMPHRIKAPKSAEHKIQSRIDEATCTVDSNGKITMSFEPISDYIACKMILRNSPSVRYSSNKKLQSLIKKCKENENFLEEMQKLRSEFLVDEDVPKSNYEYKFNYPKKAYYEQCRNLLEHLKSITDKKATHVLSDYDKKIEETESKISEIDMASAFKNIENDDDVKKVDIDDFTNPNVNFFDLLDEYTSTLYDDRDLAILTQQFRAIFKNNPMLDSLGVSLVNKKPIKEKRTKRGYTSNFVTLNTLVGDIEVQLQTQHQYREGLTGKSSHGGMEGKKIHPLKIPDFNNEDELKLFMEQINKDCPKFYHAKMDDKEAIRVLVETYSDYQRYRGLLSEIPTSVLEDPDVQQYWEKLYQETKQHKSNIFSAENGEIQGFIPYDIKNYIASDNFKELKEICKKNNLNPDYEDRINLTSDDIEEER